MTLLLSNVVLAGCLALFVVCLTKVWRNPHLAHALWLLVLVKLVTPPLVQIPLPQFILLTSEDSWGDERRRDSGIDPSSPIEQPRDPSETSSEARSWWANSQQNQSAWNRIITSTWRAASSQSQWLLAFWAVGTVVVMYIAWWRHLHLLRILAEAVEPDATVIKDLERIAHEIGLTTCPQLRVTRARISPLIAFGYRRQIVLLPSGLIAELNREQIRSVLAHELAHLRRRDHWIRPFEMLVLALYWWNPLAWWASRQLGQAEEECCDAWVIWALPESRRSYGKTLLQTLEYLTEERQVATAGVTTFGRFLFKRRIELILNRQVRRRPSSAACFMMFVIGVAVLPVAVTQSLSAEGRSERTAEEQGSASSGDNGADPVQPEAPAPEATGENEPETNDDGQVVHFVISGLALTENVLAHIEKLYWSKTPMESQLGDLVRPALTLLDVQITTAGLEHLEDVTSPVRIYAEDKEITDTGLVHGKGLKSIWRLHLRDAKVTDAGPETLAGSIKLKHLSLLGLQITNDGLNDLKSVSDSKGLEWAITKMSDDGVLHVIEPPQEPMLDEAPVNRFEYLNSFPSLVLLILAGTGISDAELAHLTGLNDLTLLDLSDTNISDEGLKHVTRLSNLTWLNLKDSNVTKGGVSRLKKSLPNCEIEFP